MISIKQLILCLKVPLSLKMKVQNEELIEELKTKVEQCLKRAQHLLPLEDVTLQWRESSKHWNILECIEHLNMYGDFYIPEIRKRIAGVSPQTNESLFFKYSWWANYLIKGVAPEPKEKLKKLNAFKRLNPHFKKLDRSAIDKFIYQQKELLLLLEDVKHLNLNKIKTDSTIPMVRLRLGDTLRAEVYHNQRHLNQAFDVWEKATIIPA